MSIMTGQKYGNVKNLLEAVPPGFIVDSAWLEANGIGRRSVYDYVQQGWLERLARGVFRRPAPRALASEKIDWKSCVLSMQHIMRYPVHLGGMTALALQGHNHYLALGDKAPVWLYGADVPNWLKKLPLDAPLEIRSRNLFTDPELGKAEARGEQRPDNTGSLPWDWALRMSAPERAVVEALDELPDHESFHNLDMAFEGLTTLRPKLLASLLNDCRKIKVRRLFFVFADRHGHAWRKRLNPEDFDLGRGDRALVKGGRIHPRYRIVVPETFAEAGNEGRDGK